MSSHFPLYLYNYWVGLYQIYKFYALHTVYMILCINLKKLGSVASSWGIYSWKMSDFSHFSLHHLKKLNQSKTKSLWIISFKFSTPIRTLWPILAYILEMFKPNMSESWMIISLIIFKRFSHIYWISHWRCGLESHSIHYPLRLLWRIFKFDQMVNNHLSSCN